MRILLVGEYSNLHNSLKAGLEALGHTVVLMASGDGFKRLPADIDVRGSIFQDIPLFNLIRKGVFKVSKHDLALLETAWRVRKKVTELPTFDVVQLINEYPLKTPYSWEQRMIKNLRSLAPKMAVLACGDDYIYLKNIHKLPYHPISQHKGTIDFPFSELYLTKRHRKFHKYVAKLRDIVIASDIDYHSIYKGRNGYYGMIPNPINLDILMPVELPPLDKIIIFHGINQTNYYKKGNDFFHKALSRILKKYQNKIEVITATSLPYDEYISKYDSAHIILDQVYSLDQGYNALEAMAKGKVVFTGAGEEFCATYGLEQDRVAIHVVPDENQIAAKLEELIQRPEQIPLIGAEARKFIEAHHDYKECATQYIKAWESIVPKNP